MDPTYQNGKQVPAIKLLIVTARDALGQSLMMRSPGTGPDEGAEFYDAAVDTRT